jgi:P pilus assembly chaperone PapD
MSFIVRPALRILLRCLIAGHFVGVGATGIQPDTTIVRLSAGEGQAQMTVRNTDPVPLLMNVTVQDLPGSESLTVLALPQVTRVEANGHQIVRFVLAESARGITKQYLKRVSFEGIPPQDSRAKGSGVAINVRQVIPLVISPPGLEQDPEPWKRLKIVRKASGVAEIRNDSPFVARLRSEGELLPQRMPIRLLANTYVLPGEHIAVGLPPDVEAASVRAIRIQPASPWGISVEPYEIQLSDGGMP